MTSDPEEKMHCVKTMSTHYVAQRSARVRIALARACLLFNSCSIASATTTVTYNYTGVVSSGSDADNLFGLAGQSLSGQSYTQTFIFRLAGLASSVSNYDSGSSGILYRADKGSPIITTGSITINGQTVTIQGIAEVHEQNTYAIFNNDTPPVYGIASGVDDGSKQLSGEMQTRLIPSTSGDPVQNLINPGPNISPNQSYLNDGNDKLQLYASSYTATMSDGDAASVPEPAAWTMMLSGFGMIGYALRRQRATAIKLA